MELVNNINLSNLQSFIKSFKTHDEFIAFILEKGILFTTEEPLGLTILRYNRENAACDFSAPDNNDSARVSFRLCWTVYDPFDSSTRTALSGTGRMTATDAHSAFMTGSCDYKGTGTAVTGIKFYANSDNVKNGHFRVYGIVDS